VESLIVRIRIVRYRTICQSKLRYRWFCWH